MSYLSCSAQVRTGTTSPPVNTYRGMDGVTYDIANQEIINVPNNLVLTAGLTPSIQSIWLSGPGLVVATGAILDSLGNEIVRFYPQSLIAPASSVSPTTAYSPPNPTSPLVSGEYTILTFKLYIEDTQGRTKGAGQICIGGTAITPTPTPTFVPTLTPTPTPIPPTPTPTATPVV